jgi:hypothetical protein
MDDRLEHIHALMRQKAALLDELEDLDAEHRGAETLYLLDRLVERFPDQAAEMRRVIDELLAETGGRR